MYSLLALVLDDFDWLILSGSSPSVSTGPLVDHTTGTAEGNYIYIGVYYKSSESLFVAQ